MRVLAVDYGSRRIGLATCDELELTTTGVDTIPSKGLKADAGRLLQVADAAGCEMIVVGLPLHLNGKRGRSAERAEKLARLLREGSSREVRLVDERLSSHEAAQRAASLRKGGRKRSIDLDQESARVILEDFLRLRPASSGSAV